MRLGYSYLTSLLGDKPRSVFNPIFLSPRGFRAIRRGEYCALCFENALSETFCKNKSSAIQVIMIKIV